MRVFALILLSFVFSCTATKNAVDKTGKVVVDCAVDAVKDSAADLVPIVIAVLTSDSPDWKTILGSFVSDLSRDAVACALREAAIVLQAKVPATGPDGTPEVQQTLTGMQRARSYISDQGWQYR